MIKNKIYTTLTHIGGMMIYTFGYGGQLHILYKQILPKDDILLVDVRQRPYGLVKKNRLQKYDNYISITEFGNPNYLDSNVFQRGVKKLIDKLNSGDYRKIVLMCAEKDVNRCHRKDVAELLEQCGFEYCGEFYQEIDRDQEK